MRSSARPNPSSNSIRIRVCFGQQNTTSILMIPLPILSQCVRSLFVCLFISNALQLQFWIPGIDSPGSTNTGKVIMLHLRLQRSRQPYVVYNSIFLRLTPCSRCKPFNLGAAVVLQHQSVPSLVAPHLPGHVSLKHMDSRQCCQLFHPQTQGRLTMNFKPTSMLPTLLEWISLNSGRYVLQASCSVFELT